MKHTPTPWLYNADPRVNRKVYCEYGDTLAECSKAADAAFIVRAVNCFDDMLLTLGAIEGAIEIGGPVNMSEMLKMVKASIAKAEGK